MDEAARVAEYDQALAECIGDGLLIEDESGDAVTVSDKGMTWMLLVYVGAIPLDTPKQQRRARIFMAFLRAGK